MDWLGAQPSFICEEMVCGDWVCLDEWWCPGWICEVPPGVVRRFNPYPFIFHGRPGMTRGPRQAT